MAPLAQGEPQLAHAGSTIEFDGGPERFRGYGVVTRAVMRDPSLTCEAKAIYAYLCSFAGDGDVAFPSVEAMLDELGMGRSRFYKHRQLLLDAGLLEVSKGRRAGSRYEHNVYRLRAPAAPFRLSTPPASGATRRVDPEDGGTRGERGSARGRAPFGAAEAGSQAGRSRNGTARPDEEPQMDGRSCFGDARNEAAYNGWSVCLGSPWDAGDPGPTRERPRVGTGNGAFDALAASAVNRNRLGTAAGRAETMAAWQRLVDAGFEPREVQQAFDERQRACDAAGWERTYYPQLLRWLASDARDEVERARSQRAASKARHAQGACAKGCEGARREDPALAEASAKVRALADEAMGCLRRGDSEGYERARARLAAATEAYEALDKKAA